tara:strand:+ start:3567 stop:4286 length:720 start_codon:yes stop_codon:yes gene_type:complete
MSKEKQFWVHNFEKGYYDKVIQEGLAKKKGLQSNWHNCTYLKVKEKISSENRHLDYACGSGTFIGRYLHSSSIGVDISEIQIEYARETFKETNKFYTVDEFENLDHESFDVVSILGLIEFLTEEEIKYLLKRIKNLLKNNGKIILTTPNFSLFFQTIQRISKLLGIKDYSEVTVSKFNSRKLKKMLEEEDLLEIKVKKIVNVGIFSSLLSHKMGLFFENLIGILFNNFFGFILIAEAKK